MIIKTPSNALKKNSLGFDTNVKTNDGCIT